MIIRLNYVILVPRLNILNQKIETEIDGVWASERDKIC